MAEASRREARGRQAEGSSDDDPGPARQLHRKIDRSVVKHATMTTPYGVTRGTIYTVEDFNVDSFTVPIETNLSGFVYLKPMQVKIRRTGSKLAKLNSPTRR